MSEGVDYDEKQNNLPYIAIEDNCEYQKNWNHVEKYYQNIPRDDNFRTIIINFGTPGSGKSYSTNIVKRFVTGYFGKIHEWENISHDDYVLNDYRYKDGLNELVLKGSKRKKKESRDNLEKIYNEIRKGIENCDIVNTFLYDLWTNESFWSERDDDDFKEEEIINNGTQILVYDKLIKSIKEGKNIIYEALGNKLGTVMNIFETIKKYNCDDNTHRYFIILTYNSIDVKTNKNILNTRWGTALKSLETQVEEKNSHDELPKPWLYNDDITLEKLNSEILDTINNIITQCYDVDDATGICNGIGPDILVVFDKDKNYKRSNEPVSYSIPLSDRGTILYRWKNIKRKGQFNIFRKTGKTLTKFLSSKLSNAGYKTKSKHKRINKSKKRNKSKRSNNKKSKKSKKINKNI